MQSISVAIIITQSRTANEHCPWHFLSKEVARRRRDLELKVNMGEGIRQILEIDCSEILSN